MGANESLIDIKNSKDIKKGENNTVCGHVSENSTSLQSQNKIFVKNQFLKKNTDLKVIPERIDSSDNEFSAVSLKNIGKKE